MKREAPDRRDEPGRGGAIRIEGVETTIVAGASGDAGNARRAWRTRRGLLLRLRADGLVGHGEASPLPDYSPDTFDEALESLQSWRPDSFEASVAGVRQTIEALPKTRPTARFAAETALLDLLGQRLGRPLPELLADGPVTAASANAALVSLVPEEPEQTVQAASFLLDRGFADLKIKIGRPGRFDDELRALQLLRQELGKCWRLRLDANGLLDADCLDEQLDALARLAPELVEEPVPWPALGELESSPVPLAIDEGTRLGWKSIEPWIKSGACSAVVLKPLVLGGVVPCLDLAEKVRPFGVAAIASHGFDGPVALQATCALALALDSRARLPIAHGTARHAGLGPWPWVDGLLADGPKILPGKKPGLGLDGLETIEGTTT